LTSERSKIGQISLYLGSQIGKGSRVLGPFRGCCSPFWDYEGYQPLRVPIMRLNCKNKVKIDLILTVPYTEFHTFRPSFLLLRICDPS